MNNYSVVTTNTIGKECFCSEDGRRHEIHEIAYEGFTFIPGQFVMIQVKTEAFDWSYPYMILKNTERGFAVTAVVRSSLYGKEPGTTLVLWGANGRGVKACSTDIVVAEAGTSFLTAPLAAAAPDCRMVFFGKRESAVLSSCPDHTSFFASPEEIVSFLEEERGQVFLALNLSTLLELMKNASDSLKNRSTVFASSDIACGVNGCKGCYLHSPSIAVGIPVCCCGPYLAYNQIDFEMDGKCFHHFL